MSPPRDRPAPCDTDPLLITEVPAVTTGEVILPNVEAVRFDVAATRPDRTMCHLGPVLREALSNVAKHAKASEVIVHLTVTQSSVALQVDDDGVGPEPGGHGGVRSCPGGRDTHALAGPAGPTPCVKRAASGP